LPPPSHAVLYAFGTIYWETLGFSGSQIGVLWAAGVLAEIGMFALSGRALRRFSAEKLILVGAFAAILRWGLFPLATTFVASLALQTLHALTFAAAYAGMQIALSRDVPERMMTSAQGISQTAGGVALALATILSGPLYAKLGVMAFPTMAMGGVLAILVLCIPAARVSPRDRGSAD
jgi:PPP family 3-phenylpropionic acid transporter